MLQQKPKGLRPASVAEALGVPPRSPLADMAGTDRARMVRRIERAVERLLAALDALAPEADDEPSLGFTENHPSPGWHQPAHEGSQLHGARGGSADLEHEHDGAEPDTDEF